jgi:hypothetical protein
MSVVLGTYPVSGEHSNPSRSALQFHSSSLVLGMFQKEQLSALHRWHLSHPSTGALTLSSSSGAVGAEKGSGTC